MEELTVVRMAKSTSGRRSSHEASTRSSKKALKILEYSLWILSALALPFGL